MVGRGGIYGDMHGDGTPVDGNVGHYDLERRLIEAIWKADEKELRTVIVQRVRGGSVALIEDLATLLGVPIRRKD